MKFNLGDKVKFMDQEGQGVVSRIINASTVGVTVDGFELPFSITDLLKVEKPSSTAERLFYEGKATYGTPRQEARERQKNALPGDEPFPGDESPETETGSETGESAAASPEPEKEPDDRISALSRGFTSKQPQPEGIYIGLVPLDQQFMLRGPVEFHIINYTPFSDPRSRNLFRGGLRLGSALFQNLRGKHRTGRFGLVGGRLAAMPFLPG